jgi:hypothetical protein
MPDEPHINMEELLKQYAEQRREITPPPLHSATRKMLMDEVKRVHGAADAERKAPHWLSRFWPQFAMAAGLCALVVAGLLLPERKERIAQVATASKSQETPAPVRQLSESETSQTAPGHPDLSFSAPPLQGPSGEAGSLSRDKQLADSSEPSLKGADSTVPAAQNSLAQALPALRSEPASPAVAPEPQMEKELLKPTDRLETLRLGIKKDEASTESVSTPATVRLATATNEKPQEMQVLAAAAPAQTSSPAAPQELALQKQVRAVAAARSSALNPFMDAYAYQVNATELTNMGAALRTYFVAVTNSAFYTARPAFPPVLGQFQMEQMGEQIRFVDMDGSIYDGVLTPETAAPPAVTRPFRAADSSQRGAARTSNPGAATVPSTNWAFQATGVNRTLGSEVIFRGELTKPLSPEPQVTPQPRAEGAIGGALAGAPPANKLARPTISGTATLGNTNQLPIRAIARPR